MTRRVVKERIYKKCGGQCVECGSKENLEIDHIIPLSRGGLDDESNRQLLCRSCNRKKGSSFDFSQYFQIGISPDYIQIRDDYPICSIPAKLHSEICIEMYRRNAELFRE